MSLLPMGAEPASLQGATGPSLGPFSFALQHENLIQPGCRQAGGWCAPSLSSKCGTCTFVLITRCLATRSRQRRAAVTGDRAGGSHSRPQPVTCTPSGARVETMAAELLKVQQKPLLEGAVMWSQNELLRRPKCYLRVSLASGWDPVAVVTLSHPSWQHVLLQHHHPHVLLGHVLQGASLS